MGVRGVSGRGQFVRHGLFDMAGWRCPEGDASSRWLIDIRTDLFPPTTMIAVTIASRRERSACRARPADRADRSVRRRGGQARAAPAAVARQRPRHSSSTIRRKTSPTRLRARRHGCSARGTRRRRRRRCLAAGIRRRAGVPAAGAGASAASLCSPATPQPRRAGLSARLSRTITSEPSSNTPTSRSSDPSRYDDALYGRLETGEQDYQRDPAYPDDPYAYQDEL